jgi:hypothetical protein
MLMNLSQFPKGLDEWGTFVGSKKKQSLAVDGR